MSVDELVGSPSDLFYEWNGKMGLYDGVQKMEYVKCEYWLADFSERCLERVRVEGSFTIDELVVRVEQLEINNGSVTYFAQTHL